jgi:hypothetical protein
MIDELNYSSDSCDLLNDKVVSLEIFQGKKTLTLYKKFIANIVFYILDYLCNYVPGIFECSKELFISHMSCPSSIEVIEKFISDSTLWTLSIQKIEEGLSFV